MKVLSFGEVLWDVFPTEKKIGGAPFNFAAHLVKNGVDSALYSAVGRDELGKAARMALNKLGVEDRYVADVSAETGVCLVTLDKEGTPSYNIKLDTAPDNIPVMPMESFDGFYFGTLFQRSAVTRETLRHILKTNEFRHIFVDINIRQHYYSEEVLDFSLRHATICKISREEMDVLRETGITEAQGYEAVSASLSERYPNLDMIIITLDADGSYVYDCRAGQHYYSDKPNCKVVSTVGAGDSFSATFFASILKGEDIPSALQRASKVSQYVVTRLEAVPDYPEDL